MGAPGLGTTAGETGVDIGGEKKSEVYLIPSIGEVDKSFLVPRGTKNSATSNRFCHVAQGNLNAQNVRERALKYVGEEK